GNRAGASAAGPRPEAGARRVPETRRARLPRRRASARPGSSAGSAAVSRERRSRGNGRLPAAGCLPAASGAAVNRTPFFERWLLHISVLVLPASGAAWAVMKHLLPPVDEFSSVGHPLQPWAVAAHVVATPAAVFGLGLIFRDHIALRLGRPRGTPGRLS